ncbi:MAG: LysM peptidoglycan-binding domain-containing protein [Armatimonadota bacterium]
MTTFTHRSRHIRYVPVDREHAEALEAWRRRRAARERARREAAIRRFWLAFAVIAGMLLGATIARANGPRRTVVVVPAWSTDSVRPGDTARSLADRNFDPKVPMAERLRRLEELNGGDVSFLVPGQLVRVPRRAGSVSVPNR